ncbi:hypothetical protein [Emticicia sp. BO119]|uniref:hypothetical protein n=1 Tax=Emticicia sp. BO119 TaxID=2757768 RepID=UPI0015F0B31D|nr:hypothetical protein [Emticicia sp. BO119]MBA4852049.1 hypothetical protein [Emticicia sp. BO119]
MKRTKIDFSKHELTITQINEKATTHLLKKPDTYIHSVKFTNIDGVLLVTGDFGNWVFCRSFYPSKDEKVSDGYWCEKAVISSTQITHEYDSEKTEKSIKELLQEDWNEEEKEYLNELLDHTYDGREYKDYAYNHRPSGFEYESIPYGESVKPWLKAVFDAFDEICDRVKQS